MKPSFFERIRTEQDDLVWKINAAEFDVLKQIILINSGALALIGAFAASNQPSVDSWMPWLLTIVVGLFVLSLASAVLQLVLSHLLFVNAHNFIEKLVKDTKLQEVSKQFKYYEEKGSRLKTSSSPWAYWVSICSFTFGILILSVIILIRIW